MNPKAGVEPVDRNGSAAAAQRRAHETDPPCAFFFEFARLALDSGVVPVVPSVVIGIDPCIARRQAVTGCG